MYYIHVYCNVYSCLSDINIIIINEPRKKCLSENNGFPFPIYNSLENS